MRDATLWVSLGFSLSAGREARYKQDRFVRFVFYDDAQITARAQGRDDVFGVTDRRSIVRQHHTVRILHLDFRPPDCEKILGHQRPPGMWLECCTV
jgi:hypothetical protein